MFEINNINAYQIKIRNTIKHWLKNIRTMAGRPGTIKSQHTKDNLLNKSHNLRLNYLIDRGKIR